MDFMHERLDTDTRTFIFLLGEQLGDLSSLDLQDET